MKTIYHLLGILAILLMAASCGKDDEPSEIIEPPVFNLQKSSAVEAVDLGLSVLWSNCNMGASSPRDFPRIRDFHGVNPNGFDGRGNYALGVKEQLIFPEIEYDKVEKVRGMDIVFVTTAKTDEEARELLRLMGMPFSA